MPFHFLPNCRRVDRNSDRAWPGLARAKANGKRFGRPRVAPSVEARIRDLRAEGIGLLKIGRTVGVGTSVVQRVSALARSKVATLLNPRMAFPGVIDGEK